MITTALLIVFALLAVLVLWRVARRQHLPVPDLQALAEYTRPVDLAAFRNLVDPAEEDFLRAQLPADKFRAIQRERLRAALQYVERAAHNGAILLRVGEAARGDPNPEVAAAGRELVDNALRLRLNARLATVVLYGRMVMPGARISVGRITDTYESLAQGLVRLSRLRDPSHATRVSAAI
jgi:uncharacterized protein (DUF433 family)